MNGVGSEEAPPCIEKIVHFPDGRVYQLGRVLANYRSCHDGAPAEARMIFACTPVTEHATEDMLEELVIKIKVQIPDPSRANSQSPQPGPSDTTAAELMALAKYAEVKLEGVPHLVSTKHARQSDDPANPMPGGYLTYYVMTKLPGKELLGKFWNMEPKERELIQDQFIKVLRSIHDTGIEPRDRALRNVLWDGEKMQCSIIDFELIGDQPDGVRDRTKELQRWGLARTPVPKHWWKDWFESH